MNNNYEIKTFQPNQLRNMLLDPSTLLMIAMYYSLVPESRVNNLFPDSQSDQERAIIAEVRREVLDLPNDGLYYVMFQNGQAIAFMRIVIWELLPENVEGKQFWQAIQAEDAELAKQLQTLPPPLRNVYAQDIMVHPLYRSQGVSELLYQFMVSQTQADVVTGISRTVNAVYGLASALDEYQTFFMHKLVTKQQSEQSAPRFARVIAKVFCKIEHFTYDDEGRAIEDHPFFDNLPIEVQKYKHLPNFYKLFQHLIEDDVQAGGWAPTAGVLVAIKKELLAKLLLE